MSRATLSLTLVALALLGLAFLRFATGELRLEGGGASRSTAFCVLLRRC
jgi:hypothetical protein